MLDIFMTHQLSSLHVAGLIKTEGNSAPPPASTIKHAAAEATSGDDEKSGTSSKPAAKPVTAETARKASLLQGHQCCGYVCCSSHIRHSPTVMPNCNSLLIY